MRGFALRVWEIDLAPPESPDAVEAADANALRMLTPGERSRADRLADPRDRTALIRSHAAVRSLLAEVTGLPAGQLGWSNGVHGKPDRVGRVDRVDPVGSAGAYDWNLSRSGTRALVAISGGGPIGVDLQREHPHGDPLALARRFFAPAEKEWVAASPDRTARTRRLCRLLARKEAWAKAVGSRLLDVLRLDVLRPGPKTWRGDECHLADLPVGPGYAGAIATAGRPPGRAEHLVCTWRDLCAPI